MTNISMEEILLCNSYYYNFIAQPYSALSVNPEDAGQHWEHSFSVNTVLKSKSMHNLFRKRKCQREAVKFCISHHIKKN